MREEGVNLVFWKSSQEGTQIINAIEREKQIISNELSEGYLLKLSSEELAKAYATKIGRLEGLNFIERLIQDARDDSSNEDDI